MPGRLIAAASVQEEDGVTARAAEDEGFEPVLCVQREVWRELLALLPAEAIRAKWRWSEVLVVQRGEVVRGWPIWLEWRRELALQVTTPLLKRKDGHVFTTDVPLQVPDHLLNVLLPYVA